MLTKRTHVLTSAIVFVVFLMTITVSLLMYVGPAASFLWVAFMYVLSVVLRRERIRKQERQQP